MFHAQPVKPCGMGNTRVNGYLVAVLLLFTLLTGVSGQKGAVYLILSIQHR